MTTFATYVHGAPESLSGYLWKQSPSTLRLRKYQWRYVSVENGGLYWWNTEQMAADVGILGAKGSVSFHTNSVEVEMCEDADARFFVRPLGGKWEVGGTFTAKKEGEARTFTFDTTKSAHRAREWVEAIQAHIDYAVQIKEQEGEDPEVADPETVEETPAFRPGQSRDESQSAEASDQVASRQQEKAAARAAAEKEKAARAAAEKAAAEKEKEALAAAEKAAAEKAVLEKALEKERAERLAREKEVEEAKRRAALELSLSMEKEVEAARKAAAEREKLEKQVEAARKAAEEATEKAEDSSEKRPKFDLTQKREENIGFSQLRPAEDAPRGYPPATPPRGYPPASPPRGDTPRFSMVADHDRTLKERRLSRTPPRRPLDESQDDYLAGSRRSRQSQSDRRRTSRTPPRAPSLSSTNGKESLPIDFCPQCDAYFDDNALFCENCGWTRDSRKRDGSPVPKKKINNGPLVAAHRSRLREIQGLPATKRARSVETSNRDKLQDSNEAISGAGVYFNLTVPSTLKSGRNIPEKPEEPVTIPVDMYEYFSRIWPLGRDFESRKNRRDAFRKFDISLSGLIGPIAVKCVIVRMIQIPGMNDFGPPVNLAFQSMQGVMPLDGDCIDSECLSIRCFRIFLMFLSRYMELWVHFCAMNTSWTRRATMEEFIIAAPNFESLSLQNFEDVRAHPEVVWDEIRKQNDFHMRFNEFCVFVGTYGPTHDKWETEIEPEDLLKECSDLSYRDGAKFRVMHCSIPSFQEMRSKFPLERSEAGIAARAKMYKQMDFNNMCGKVMPFEADICINNLISVPGVHTLLPAVRLAYQFTQKNRGLKYRAVEEGIEWNAFYALLYYLQRFFELWIRFIAFDFVRDYRLSCAEFTSMVLQLQLCDVVSEEIMEKIREDPVLVFKEVDKDNSGYVRFREFASFCLEKGPPHPDLSGDPMCRSIKKYYEMAIAGKFKKSLKELPPPEAKEKKKHPPVPRFKHPANIKPLHIDEPVREKKKRPPVPRFPHPNKKPEDAASLSPASSPSPSRRRGKQASPARSPSPIQKKADQRQASPARSPSPIQKKADQKPSATQQSNEGDDEPEEVAQVAKEDIVQQKEPATKEKQQTPEAPKEKPQTKEEAETKPEDASSWSFFGGFGGGGESAEEQPSNPPGDTATEQFPASVKASPPAKVSPPKGPPLATPQVAVNPKQTTEEGMSASKATLSAPPAKSEEAPPPKAQAAEASGSTEPASTDPADGPNQPAESMVEKVEKRPSQAGIEGAAQPPPEPAQPKVANPKQSTEERLAAFKAKLSAPPGKAVGAPPPKAASPEGESTVETLEKRLSQVASGSSLAQSTEERLAAFKAKLSAPPATTVPAKASPEGSAVPKQSIEERLAAFKAKMGVPPPAVAPSSTSTEPSVADRLAAIRAKQGATASSAPALPASTTESTSTSLQERMAAIKAKQAELKAKQDALAAGKKEPSPESFSNLPTAASESDIAK